MSTISVNVEPLAVDAGCTDEALKVILVDGREITVPLAWFPRLQAATPAQRKNWRLIGGGIGIHWEDVDEDISVESLLATKPLFVGSVDPVKISKT
ncbi:MAG: DUF2442 domain-containing protein [Thermoanaerobaculia bacterium]